jgi:hypothetical protein
MQVGGNSAAMMESKFIGDAFGLDDRPLPCAPLSANAKVV